MKTEDHRASAGFHPVGQRDGEELVEVFELVVDGDPQGLKDTCGWVNFMTAFPRMRQSVGNDGDQIADRPLRQFVSPRDDGPGDGPAGALFSGPLKEVGQLVFVERCQEIGSGWACRRVETHVERSIASEAALDAETARRVGQLVGRKPQIKQHAVDAADSERVEDLRQLCITGLFQSRARVGEDVGGPRKHRRIAIQSDQFSVVSELFEDEFAMTAAADRAIHHHQSRAEIQVLQNFPDQNGSVYGRARITAGRRRIGHCLEEQLFGEGTNRRA
jgi:hypothetical protein